MPARWPMPFPLDPRCRQHGCQPPRRRVFASGDCVRRCADAGSRAPGYAPPCPSRPSAGSAIRGSCRQCARSSGTPPATRLPPSHGCSRCASPIHTAAASRRRTTSSALHSPANPCGQATRREGSHCGRWSASNCLAWSCGSGERQVTTLRSSRWFGFKLFQQGTFPMPIQTSRKTRRCSAAGHYFDRACQRWWAYGYSPSTKNTVRRADCALRPNTAWYSSLW